MSERKKLFSFLQKNYGWITAFTTIFAAIVSGALKAVNYLKSSLYFSYYGLTYELYDKNQIGFTHNFILSVLIALCFYSLIYCFEQIIHAKKLKISYLGITINVILILIFNFIISYLFFYQFGIKYIIFTMFILIIGELISDIVLHMAIKKSMGFSDKNQVDVELKNYVKLLPFMLFVIVMLVMFLYTLSIKENNVYRVVEDDKVIVYATSDYYLLLDCEIGENNIVIYKGTQEKVPNNNVKSSLKRFETVKVILKEE